jgi:hypothetical protein
MTHLSLTGISTPTCGRRCLARWPRLKRSSRLSQHSLPRRRSESLSSTTYVAALSLIHKLTLTHHVHCILAHRAHAHAHADSHAHTHTHTHTHVRTHAPYSQVPNPNEDMCEDVNGVDDGPVELNEVEIIRNRFADFVASMGLVKLPPHLAINPVESPLSSPIAPTDETPERSTTVTLVHHADGDDEDENELQEQQGVGGGGGGGGSLNESARSLNESAMSTDTAKRHLDFDASSADDEALRRFQEILASQDDIYAHTPHAIDTTSNAGAAAEQEEVDEAVTTEDDTQEDQAQPEQQAEQQEQPAVVVVAPKKGGSLFTAAFRRFLPGMKQTNKADNSAAVTPSGDAGNAAAASEADPATTTATATDAPTTPSTGEPVSAGRSNSSNTADDFVAPQGVSFMLNANDEASAVTATSKSATPTSSTAFNPAGATVAPPLQRTNTVSTAEKRAAKKKSTYGGSSSGGVELSVVGRPASKTTVDVNPSELAAALETVVANTPSSSSSASPPSSSSQEGGAGDSAKTSKRKSSKKPVSTVPLWRRIVDAEVEKKKQSYAQSHTVWEDRKKSVSSSSPSSSPSTAAARKRASSTTRVPTAARNGVELTRTDTEGGSGLRVSTGGEIADSIRHIRSSRGGMAAPTAPTLITSV